MKGYLSGAIEETADTEIHRIRMEKYRSRDPRIGVGEFQRLEDGIYKRESSPSVMIDLGIGKKWEDVLRNSDLVVLGCTFENEVCVDLAKNTGSLFVRCSMFYGMYNKRLPEEVGYAFDIPEERDVLSFVLDQGVAIAILERDSELVKRSVCEFNHRLGLSRPVIITPHLDVAMRIPRAEQNGTVESFINSGVMEFAGLCFRIARAE